MDRAGLGYRPSPVEPHRSSLSPAISVTWIREGKGQQTGLLSLKSCPIGWGPEVHQATSSCFSFASCHTCYYRARKEMTHERLLASARQSMSMCVHACVCCFDRKTLQCKHTNVHTFCGQYVVCKINNITTLSVFPPRTDIFKSRLPVS